MKGDVMTACGLDFGTSNSAIGVARGNALALAPLEHGRTLMPTAVFFDYESRGRVLFGSESKNQQRGDLMIALIPHIVRTPDYTAENLRGIYAGTDQVVKINYAPRADAPAPATPATCSPSASRWNRFRISKWLELK